MSNEEELVADFFNPIDRTKETPPARTLADNVTQRAVDWKALDETRRIDTARFADRFHSHLCAIQSEFPTGVVANHALRRVFEEKSGAEGAARLWALLTGRDVGRTDLPVLDQARVAIRKVLAGARETSQVLCPVLYPPEYRAVILVKVTPCDRPAERISLDLTPWSYFLPLDTGNGTWLETWQRDLQALAELKNDVSRQISRFGRYLIDLSPAPSLDDDEYSPLHVKGESIGLAIVLGALAAGLGMEPRTFAATGAIGTDGPAKVSGSRLKLKAVQLYAEQHGLHEFPYYCPTMMDETIVQQGKWDRVDVRVLESWEEVWNKRNDLFTDGLGVYREWIRTKCRPAAARPQARWFDQELATVVRDALYYQMPGDRQDLPAANLWVPVPFFLHAEASLDAPEGWILEGVRAGLRQLGAPEICEHHLRRLVRDRSRLRLVAFSHRTTVLDRYEVKEHSMFERLVSYARCQTPHLEVVFVPSDGHHELFARAWLDPVGGRVLGDPAARASTSRVDS